MPDAAAPLMTLHTTLGDDALRFRSLAATEELGRPFEFVVGALSDDPAIVTSLKSLFGLGWGLSLPYSERSEAAKKLADPMVQSVVQNLAKEARRIIVTA